MVLKKKVLVPIFHRAHYGRLRSVLEAIRNHPNLELQIMTASSTAYDYLWFNLKHSQSSSKLWAIKAWLTNFFNPGMMKNVDFLIQNLDRDGFLVNSRIPLFLEGGVAETMAKSVGLGILKIVDELKRLKPDIVFVNADRFEMMAVALSAAYLNIPIAHNEGGDVSGTIDESIRHSITKMAHIHFTATEKSRGRVIQMGENPENAFLVGSPCIDVLKKLDLRPHGKSIGNIDLSKPFLLVLLHPVVTADEEYNAKAVKNTINVIEELKMPTLFLGPNKDAKSDQLADVLKDWLKRKPAFVHITKHLHPDDFYRALAATSCAIGNSSSFIREGAYLGTPAVMIGSRQNNRDRDNNVLEVGVEAAAIKAAIEKQIKNGRYASSGMFGGGNSGEKIAAILASTQPNVQKYFNEI